MGNLPFSSPDEDQLYADEKSRSTLEVSTSWDDLLKSWHFVIHTLMNDWEKIELTFFLSIFNDLSLVKAGCFFKIIIFFINWVDRPLQKFTKTYVSSVSSSSERLNE